jgi:aminoglycoside phosphotransferase family enzyme
VRAPLLQSLDELESLVGPADGGDLLPALRTWEAAAFDRLHPLMAQRLAQGRVRECHGDLHLGNVTVIDGRSTVFDGIEFSDDFRWIDVLSEVAFMAMDLHAHGLPHLAHRFVNAYLEFGGDYDGVPVLDYYLVHRALVRAKVHGLRSSPRPRQRRPRRNGWPPASICNWPCASAAASGHLRC